MKKRGILIKKAAPTWKNILVPIDFSTVSLRALRQAISIADQSGGRVSMIHVIEPYMAYMDEGRMSPPVADLAKVRALATKKLARLASRIYPAIRGKRLVSYGKSFEEITAAAKKMKADLIVLTTHGRTGWKHVFLGSTTERVVRYARCPVLVIHGA